MRVLFTGFTSRTVGSDRLSYDFLSNVSVLRRALELAGHEVDCRQVSLLNDPCVEEDYDCAVVGIAACQGLSSRFKLGALWALHRFGSRAGIFPSDGRNIYVFPSSVKTCLTGEHYDGATKLDPIDYFLGYLQREKNNTVDVELGRELKDVWRATLQRLPHDERAPKCDWKMLVPVHSWGNPLVYSRHFGAPVTAWDPTNIAIPMQFAANELDADGRIAFASGGIMSSFRPPRARSWVVSSLQDQGAWIKKQKCAWPVVTVGNKRKARAGEGADYIPERELIHTYYREHWGHLAFGYPLSDGSWWRMRYVHAGLAGIVTCCDDADQRRMPAPYQFTRGQIERMDDARLQALALEQHRALRATAWSVEEAVSAVDAFVRGLA